MGDHVLDTVTWQWSEPNIHGTMDIRNASRMGGHIASACLPLEGSLTWFGKGYIQPNARGDSAERNAGGQIRGRLSFIGERFFGGQLVQPGEEKRLTPPKNQKWDVLEVVSESFTPDEAALLEAALLEAAGEEGASDEQDDY